MKDTAWSIVFGILVITIVFMLVRPGSPAGTVIKDVGAAMVSLVSTAIHGPSGISQPSNPGNPTPV